MTVRPEVRADLALREGYHSPQVEVAVRLNTNEAPWPPPASFVAQLTDAVARVAWNRYPDRSATRLRDGIGALHGVDRTRVFAANGSNEVLQTVCLAYGGAGRSVLVFEPTYAMHSHIAQITGAEVIVASRGADFAVDPVVATDLLATRRPAITFLCSPNNPTGTLEPESTVKAVVDAASTYGGLVVVDEAYGQFAPWSALSLVQDDLPLVVTRTFSKTWSMAAARLGYLVGPTWLVGALEDVVLPYHLDAVTQLAGTLALDHVAEMEERVASIVAERERLVAHLAELPLTVWPSSANFVLVRPDASSGDELWHALVDRSVLVRNCASWPGLHGCLRITVGTPTEDDLLLRALEEILL